MSYLRITYNLLTAIFIVFLVCSYPPDLYGQTDHLYFQSLQKPLSNKFIRCIVKDSRGFMWFGTYNGLNKYDGTNITAYVHDPADSTSLCNNTINALTEDHDSILWIGTTEGLNAYDKQHDCFIDPNTLPGIKNQLNFSCVTALNVDKNNRLWIGTLGGGINIFDSGRLKYEFLYLAGTPDRGDGRDYINCLLTEYADHMWVGTRKGLLLVNTTTKMTLPYLDNQSHISLSNTNIISIVRNNDQSFWVATSDHGLLLLQKKQNNFYEVTTFEEYAKSKVLSTKRIITLCLSGNKALWIGTENDGLTILDQSTRKTFTYLPHEGDPSSIASNSVWSLYADNEERMWIGTYNKGICIVDPLYNRFEGYRRNPFMEYTLSDNDVTGFSTDTEGNIWVITDGGGISIFNAGTKQFIRTIKKESDGVALNNNALKCIISDSENNMWVGSWGSGVEKIGHNGKTITDYPVKAGGVGDNNILCLYEDSKKNIWAGTAGSGLFLFKKKEWQFTQMPEQGDDIGIPSIAFVTSILEDRSGTFWIGTLYGLYVFHRQLSGSLTKTVYYHDGQPGSLSSDRVQTIFEDHEGNIWAGTFDAGLNRYNKHTGTFDLFQKQQGLASEMIQDIQEDNKGNLWISSDKGIARFHPQTGNIRVYTEEDGLLSDAMYHEAGLITKEGRLFFGTDNGFNTFCPDSIPDNRFKPLMYFTGFKLNNEQVSIQSSGSVLQNHIGAARQITLNHTQTTFTIEYVGISYTRPSGNSYRYKMTGMNDDWNYAGNQTSVTFNGLSPGKYRFVVEGANNDGIWCEKPAEIDIIIKPPFWKTWWAYAMYIIFTFLAIIVIFRIRLDRLHMLNSLKMERMEREKEHELNQYKMQFFTNISHELRTPLSLIKAPLESIISSEKPDDVVKEKVTAAYKNTNRLMQLVNNLLDFRKIENEKMSVNVQNGDIIKFITESSASFHELAEERNIAFQVNAKSPSIIGWFDRKILEIILFNLLSNAFKYTPDGGYIRIEIEETFPGETDMTDSSAGQITISVTDNGRGIHPKDIPYIFDRFYQSKSSAGKGSGIGLSLVKSLVELHHGTIDATSVPGMETTFTLRFPAGENAYTADERSEIPVDIEDAGLNIHPESEQYDDRLPVIDEGDKPGILIVEDNKELRDYLAGEMHHHFQVTVAENGQQGTTKAKEMIPDLIISDILMPAKSGTELCRELKEDIKTSHIPIILLTAKSTLEEQVKGLEHGADVYITKPFSIRFLKAQIHQLITNRERLFKAFSQEVYLTPAKYTKNKLDEEFLLSIINYIVENISKNELGVDTVAVKMHLSRGQFYKKIKALTGLTAVEFIRSIRLKQAVKLMETRKYSLAEIAYQTGFTTPSYFTRSFKDHFGKSPSEFLKSGK